MANERKEVGEKAILGDDFIRRGSEKGGIYGFTADSKRCNQNRKSNRKIKRING